MLKDISTPELIIIAVVVILLLGSKKIPEFVRGIGEAVREFRNAFKGNEKDNR